MRRRSGRAVRWRLRAQSGLTTQQVHALLRTDPSPVAALAVVLTDLNDVIDLIPPQELGGRFAMGDAGETPDSGAHPLQRREQCPGSPRSASGFGQTTRLPAHLGSAAT